MIFNYKFKGDTTVNSSSGSVDMNFAPDTFREPTYFSGYLNKHIAFREAISALHDIVVSDFRYKPKDKTAYKEWAQQQEEIWLADFMKGQPEVEAKIKVLHHELQEIYKKKHEIIDPFYKAQRKYLTWLYDTNPELRYVYDPVITVHPDELFFECFSQDESSYGKLGCNYNVFKKVNEFKCGTTNIDYSADLYNEFQKIRDYKETHFNIDPSGFEVQTTAEDTYKEVKIDVPASWVRGLLQVSSAMSFPAVEFDLHPMDLYNILFTLKRHKEKEGPRSIKYILNPGQPVKVLIEPWNYEIECPRSPYNGNEKKEIRVWGRRRLMLLERLIPVTKKIKVVLLGTGLPSFYVADLGDMNFTLGLSGWTTNDWSRLGNFDLLAPRTEVDSMTMQKVFLGLKTKWVEKPEVLAKDLNLSNDIVLGALSAFTQAGKTIYDVNNRSYRIRELSRESLPMEELRFANPREESANKLLKSGAVEKVNAGKRDGKLIITGIVKEKGVSYNPEIVIDSDERLVAGKCTCNFFNQNKLMLGPCEHMLALRMDFNKKQKGN